MHLNTQVSAFFEIMFDNVPCSAKVLGHLNSVQYNTPAKI